MRSGVVRGTVEAADVTAAAERLLGVACQTPVLRSAALDEMSGAQVWLKAEHLQRAGSFKFRGAYNAVASLSGAERSVGVSTVSSGNHAQALALSGHLLGIPVLVVVPKDAPESKMAAALAYGAEIRYFDRYAVPQAEIAARLLRSRRGVYISAHDDWRVVSGAATLARELMSEVADLDTFVMAVGGGGGLAGAGVVARHMDAGCRVVGVESQASGVNRRSLVAGRRITVPVPDTIADGLTLMSPGALTFGIMRNVVDEVVLVTDQEIVEAMRFMHDRGIAMLEPSGAAGVAAVLAGKVSGRRIGVVLSGGNIDRARFDHLTRVSASNRA